MSFPISPANNAPYTLNGVTYTYNLPNNIWARTTIESPGTIALVNINATGNVNSGYFIGNGYFLSSVAGGTTYSNTNVGQFLPTYTGNIAAGNLNAATAVYSPSYYYPNGTAFSGGTTYSNANVAAYLVANPPAGSTYSNANVAGYLVANPEPGTYSNTNVSQYLPTNTANISANSLTLTGNLIISVTGNANPLGEIQSGRMMGLLPSYSDLRGAGFPYDVTGDGRVNSADSLAILKFVTQTQVNSAGLENLRVAYGSSYGSKRVGIGFHSGTVNDIAIAGAGGTPRAGAGSNVNAVVFGYMSNGPRILAQDSALADDQGNVISYVSTYHRFAGNLNIGGGSLANAAYPLDVSGTANVNSLITTNGVYWPNGVPYSTTTVGSGTVTSVSGTGTVNGLTLSGTVTSSGSLTLGGTLSLTSNQVTTALGYTPTNYANANVAAYLVANPEPGTYSNTSVSRYLPTNTANISVSNLNIISGGSIKFPDGTTQTTAAATKSISGSYTVTTADNQTTLEAASGTTITLGALASAVKIEIVQTGTGTVTISGSNLNSRVASGAVILSAQYSGCTVYNNSGGTLANWVVVGDIAGT